MKKSTSDKYLAAMCVAFVVFLGCGVAALCLLSASARVWIFSLAQFLAILAALGLTAYFAVLLIVAKRKAGAAEHFVLSFEVVFVSAVLIALSPVALIVWAIESVCEAVSAGNRD